MVMPRAFSSGEESISSFFLAALPNFLDFMVVIVAVKVVLPWSTCPMVPTFTCCFVRSNFSLAMFQYPIRSKLFLGNDCFSDAFRRLGVMLEFHRVGRAPLRH